MDEARKGAQGGGFGARGGGDARFDGALRLVFTRSVDEAHRAGSANVEAEHLLLAILAESTHPAVDVLRDAGLDHDRLIEALREERVRSLAAAGVAPIPDGRLTAAPRDGRPGWGASAKEAVGRGHRYRAARRGRRPAETDLLAGILQARLGTVPRALAIAGIDIDALLGRLQRM